MRKISDMFDTCEGAYSEEAETNHSFHPLTRTPRVVGGVTDETEVNRPGVQARPMVSWLVGCY